MNLDLRIIPHNTQRYETVGDYWMDEKEIYQVRISKMSDWRYEFLVAFHEIFELAWVIWKKVDIKDIDKFDRAYEENRKEGDVSEPGDDTKAPYYQGHQWATVLEKIAAAFLGVNWKKYDSEVINL